MLLAPATDLAGAVNAYAANYAQDSSGDPKQTVAGATEDNVKVTGLTIDRQGYDSAVLAIAGAAVLAQDKTASFAVEYQDSADGSTWNTAVAMQASTVAATGGTGGSTENFVIELGLNLRNRQRYVRFNVQMDLSASATDVCSWSAAAILGGKEKLPVA